MDLKLLLVCFCTAVLMIPAQSRGLKKKLKLLNLGKQGNWVTDDDQSNEDADDEDIDSDWVFKLQEPDGRCNPNPCLNNGVCVEKGKRHFQCDCPEPFKGKKCQKAPKPCKRRTCQQGDCVVTSTAPFYECKCKEPFQPPNCERADEVCQNNPCRNGGTCVSDDTTDFRCECPAGFTGHLCDVGPKDCYQDRGESYRGNVSETAYGFQCLHWNSYFLLDRGTDPFIAYEDDDGLGHHNFCRNPDGDRKPWCFIRVGRKLRWDFCNVRKCPADDEPWFNTSTSEPSDAPQTTEGPTPTTIVPSTRPQFSTCGKPQPTRNVNRIYGGLKSIPGAQPWQLSLQARGRRTNTNYRHICGAALISSCWALTAAHCIRKNNEMRVMAGGLTLASEESTAQIIEVEFAKPHENYTANSKGLYNDIALLKLNASNGSCAKETQFVKAACLPDTVQPDGKECTISGWGTTDEDNTLSNHLLDAEVLLISQETCSSPEVYGNVLDDSMICAGYLQGGVDSCQGDSGGPLTCEDEATHVLYGLVSWGDGCAKKNKPGIYTRVIHFLDWIKANVGDA